MNGAKGTPCYLRLHERVARSVRRAGVRGLDADLLAADLLAREWEKNARLALPQKLAIEHAVVDFKRALTRQAKVRDCAGERASPATDANPESRAEGRHVRAAVKDGLRSLRRIGTDALDIMALRCGRAMTQTQVARCVGVSQATVSRRLGTGLDAMRSELLRRGITAARIAATPRALLIVRRTLARRAKRVLDDVDGRSEDGLQESV